MTLPPGAGEHRPHGDLPPLPAWAKTLQRRIRQRGLDFFILYGPGVRDLHPLGARRFGTMGEFLSEVMLGDRSAIVTRSEEHTSELQSHSDLVCRLLLEKK